MLRTPRVDGCSIISNSRELAKCDRPCYPRLTGHTGFIRVIKIKESHGFLDGKKSKPETRKLMENKNNSKEVLENHIRWSKHFVSAKFLLIW